MFEPCAPVFFRRPFLTGRQPERTVLFNFRGNAHLQQPKYSMGLRQQLYTLLNGRPDQCARQGHTRSAGTRLGRV